MEAKDTAKMAASRIVAESASRPRNTRPKHRQPVSKSDKRARGHRVQPNVLHVLSHSLNQKDLVSSIPFTKGNKIWKHVNRLTETEFNLLFSLKFSYLHKYVARFDWYLCQFNYHFCRIGPSNFQNLDVIILKIWTF